MRIDYNYSLLSTNYEPKNDLLKTYIVDRHYSLL